MVTFQVATECRGKDTLLNDKELQNMFGENPSMQLFLKTVGFISMMADDVELLSYKWNNRLVLMDVYTVLYIFSIRSWVKYTVNIS